MFYSLRNTPRLNPGAVVCAIRDVIIKRLAAFVAIALTAVGGCRLLETGYGCENVIVRTSASIAIGFSYWMCDDNPIGL